MKGRIDSNERGMGRGKTASDGNGNGRKVRRGKRFKTKKRDEGGKLGGKRDNNSGGLAARMEQLSGQCECHCRLSTPTLAPSSANRGLVGQVEQCVYPFTTLCLQCNRLHPLPGSAQQQWI